MLGAGGVVGVEEDVEGVDVDGVDPDDDGLVEPPDGADEPAPVGELDPAELPAHPVSTTPASNARSGIGYGRCRATSTTVLPNGVVTNCSTIRLQQSAGPDRAPGRCRWGGKLSVWTVVSESC